MAENVVDTTRIVYFLLRALQELIPNVVGSRSAGITAHHAPDYIERIVFAELLGIPDLLRDVSSFLASTPSADTVDVPESEIGSQLPSISDFVRRDFLERRELSRAEVEIKLRTYFLRIRRLQNNLKRRQSSIAFDHNAGTPLVGWEDNQRLVREEAVQKDRLCNLLEYVVLDEILKHRGLALADQVFRESWILRVQQEISRNELVI
ncbi:hypothetical protein BIU96_18065 [Curtobacterium sp. MCBA15_008]|nr:hypothetical protein BIU96_18065 [Curtobacterium sp. MCBA15_008]